MKILIAGDVVPTESNLNLFANKNIKELLGEDLYDIWHKNKYKIFNLETPICENSEPIKKEGPNLIADVSSINGIKELNPTVVCLANNHILDYGEKGCKMTMNLLEKNDIQYVGVGENTYKMKKYHIIKDEEMSIGIFACCETEFSFATPNSYGANTYDEFTTFDDIRELKSKCDKVIVLYHGAKEYYRYPSPRIQKLCRKFIDSGANLVVCQHSHCIGTVEEYKNAKIVYGQGNFIFDKSNNEFWSTGLLLLVDLSETNTNIEYLPILKCEEKVRLIHAGEKEYNEIMNDFYERNEKIKDEEFIISNYKKFADEYITEYLNGFTHKTFFFKVINKVMKQLMKRQYKNYKYSLDDYLHLINVLRCDAHRELLTQGLKNKIENYGKHNK